MTPASRVERNFSRGAVSYDRASAFQSSVADALASMLETSSGVGAGDALDVLELGCGTGLLTERILRRLPNARILASDLSCSMLDVSKCKFASDIESGRLKLLEHDFNNPLSSAHGPFDLILSSLAFQWGADLGAVVKMANAALKPQGALLVSLPLAGSLSGLSKMFARSGVRFPGLPLPDEKSLRGILESCFGSVSIEVADFDDACPSLHESLRRLQELGTVNAGAPVPLRDLRRLLRSSDGVVTLDYKVAFCRCAN